MSTGQRSEAEAEVPAAVESIVVSMESLCGVGLPRPNFQRLIAYVEPEQLEVKHRRRPTGGSLRPSPTRSRSRSRSHSSSSLSETRLTCPEAFVRTAIVEVNPLTGTPLTWGRTVHRSLNPRPLLAHCNLQRCPKLMDLPEERQAQAQAQARAQARAQAQAQVQFRSQARAVSHSQSMNQSLEPKAPNLQLIYQREDLPSTLDPHRVRAQMDFGLLMPQKQMQKEVRLVRDKATSMGSLAELQESLRLQAAAFRRRRLQASLSYVVSRSRSIPSSQEKQLPLHPPLEVELGRVMIRYGVSASQLAKKLKLFAEQEEILVEEEQQPKGSVYAADDDSDDTITEEKVGSTESKEGQDTETESSSRASSHCTTDSQGNELCTQAGLTAAFAKTHEVFQRLARQSRSESPPKRQDARGVSPLLVNGQT